MTNVIKEFLVSLGYKVDEQGLKKFTDGIATATKGALALGATVTAAAAAVEASVVKIASQYEKLYYASSRIHASVAEITQTTFAAGQMGSSVDAAMGSLEGLGSFLRSNPGSETFIHSLGVQTRDANGELRSTTALMNDLGTKFRHMPYYRAKVYSSFLGIDENTMRAMINGMGPNSAQYAAMIKTSGIDMQRGAEASRNFMNEVRLLTGAFSLLGQSAALALIKRIEPSIVQLRKSIMDNFQKISRTLKSGGTSFINMAEFVIKLSARMITWLGKLDDATNGWSTTIIALAAAWRFFNLAFLLTPIGFIVSSIVALGVALAALLDDYLTWKNGGKSLINWSDWEPGIESAISGIKDLIGVIHDLYEAITHPWYSLKGFGHGVGKAILDFVYQRDINGGLPSDPVGIRQNNPGNLRSWGHAAVKNGFAVFNSAGEGISAMTDNLMNYGRKNLDTVSKIISKWAPSADHNDTEAYIQDVSKRLGVGPNDKLDLSNPATMKKLVTAMIRHENGRMPYSPDLISSAVDSRLRGGMPSARLGGRPSGGGTAVIHQKTDIHVEASPTAEQTGKNVANHQGRVNGDIVRNMKGALQ